MYNHSVYVELQLEMPNCCQFLCLMAKAIVFFFHAKAMWRGAPHPVAATAHMCQRNPSRVPRLELSLRLRTEHVPPTTMDTLWGWGSDLIEL